MGNSIEKTNLENFKLLILDCKEHRKLYNESFVSEDDIETMNNILSDYKRVLKENEELKADNYEYQGIQNIFDERTYRKKYLEERREENLNLLYPDADEIYERYYKLKKENEELKIIKSLIQTLEVNQVQEDKYILITKRDFLSGSYKSLLDDYIPVQKVKDIIERIDYDIKKPKKLYQTILIFMQRIEKTITK